MQIVDEKDGPTTKREYDIATIPVGEGLVGSVVDFLGRRIGSNTQVGTSAELPLFNQQPTMDDREQICEPLLTGVKVRLRAIQRQNANYCNSVL